MKRITPIILAVLVTLSSFISLTTLPVSAIANQVPNPSAETVSSTDSTLPSGWLTGNWGSNTAVFTYDTTGHTGTRSLKVQLTKYTSGDAKWYFTPQAVTPGSTYTYSDYYKSTAVTSLVAQYDNGAGVYTYATLNSKVAKSSTAWTQVIANFTVPAGVKNVTIFHLIKAVGTLSIDDASLTPTTPVVIPSTPVVSVITPTSNSSETGTVSLVASAADTNGIASVQFKIDGTPLGSALTSSPYQTTWDTTTTTNGAHSITAVATNTQGTSATSAPISVIVSNAVVTPPVTPPVTTTNLLTNPSVETPDPTTSSQPLSWLKGGWGTNTSTLSYLSTGGEDGTHSLKVQTTSFTSGDVKWYFAPVAVTAGTQYTYSDYYQSNISSEVVAQFDNGSGTYSYLDLGAANSATTWTQYSKSFTVPAGIKNVTIFHLIAGVGSLQTDNFSLTVSTVVTPPATPPVTATNPILNPSLETANAGQPVGWLKDGWGTNTATYSYITIDGHNSSSSAQLTVTNYKDGDAKWYFTPITGITPSTTYQFSAWYKTNTQPHAVIMYTDASGTAQYKGLPEPLSINTATSWQHYTATFSLPAGATSMTVFMLLSSNGTLDIDDYSITPYVPVGFSEPLVSLTFDDGWESSYMNGLPLLKQYGFVSTQYIISGYLGAPEYMTIPEIAAFQAQGSEIGSHTVDHPDLTTLSQANLTYQLTQSLQTLQATFGPDVAKDFASPYGAYNKNVLTNIALYYQSHRSTDDGYNSKDTFNPYNILVQNIDITTTPAQVAAWVAHAQATNTWLVLVYHQVDNSGDEYSVTPANLNAELAALKASNVSVKTVQQALAEVESQL